MALAYTAPTWTDGSGQGITASQLQALCNCVEGLVQGSDKAIHSISVNGSVITVTFSDGSIGTVTMQNAKFISSITKTGTEGLVDTYTITFSDGSTSTFTVTNGNPGGGDMYASDYDSDDTVKDAGGIVEYVESVSGKWTNEVTAAAGSTSATLTASGVTSESHVEIWSDDGQTPNVAVPYNSYEISTDTIVVNFDALERSTKWQARFF